MRLFGTVFGDYPKAMCTKPRIVEPLLVNNCYSRFASVLLEREPRGTDPNPMMYQGRGGTQPCAHAYIPLGVDH